MLGALAAMLVGQPHADPGRAQQRLRRAPAAGLRPDRSPRPGRGRRRGGGTAVGVDVPRAPRVRSRPYGSGRAFVQPQPKGVIGNIVPWNFPFDLSVGPLVQISPPATARDQALEYAQTARSSCANGPRHVRPPTARRGRRRPGAGRAFTRLPFDHLVFTGAPRSARSSRRPARSSCPSRWSSAASPRRSSPRTASTAADRILTRKASTTGRCASRPITARPALQARRVRSPGGGRENDPRLEMRIRHSTGMISTATSSAPDVETRSRAAPTCAAEPAGDFDPPSRQLPVLVLDPTEEIS